MERGCSVPSGGKNILNKCVFFIHKKTSKKYESSALCVVARPRHPWMTAAALPCSAASSSRSFCLAALLAEAACCAASHNKSIDR